MFFSYGYMFYIPVNLIYALIILFYGIKKNNHYPYYIFATIMAVYINVAINLVYFPIITETPEVWGSLENYIDISLNFFKMGGRYQVLGNILLTIPIGILSPFILSLKKRKRWGFVIAISCAVEIVQLFIIYFAHSVTLYFDIKDILLNVCGGIIGCVLFEILAKIILAVIDSNESNTFFRYLYNKCNS